MAIGGSFDAPIPFDPNQITHPENRSQPSPGQPSPGLTAHAPPRSDAGRDGEAKTPSPDAEGRVRLRDPGFTVEIERTPTLDASQPHTVAAFGFAWQQGGDGAGTMGGGIEVAPPQRCAQTMAVAHTLRGGGFDASEDGTGRGTPLVPAAMAVRRLTPRECERLQGFPDDYTVIPGAKDGPRYRALGNSMAVPVMRWIGQRIQMVEDALAAQTEAA